MYVSLYAYVYLGILKGEARKASKPGDLHYREENSKKFVPFRVHLSKGTNSNTAKE